MNSYQIIDNTLAFECGCQFEIKDGEPVFDIDLHHPNHTVNFACPLTYQTLSDGLVEGIFQLCSPLGKQWCGKVKPSNLEHMAALGALLRPGCLNSKDKDGISTTIHYERRKTGKEATPLYHPVVDEILKNTFQCLCIEENTLVSLANGDHKFIKDINETDIVCSLNINNLKIENMHCDGCRFSRTDKGIKIILSNGFSVVVTEDHKILTIDGWKKAIDITEDDAIAISIADLSKTDGKLECLDFSDEISFAYLLGQLVGDGDTVAHPVICSGSEEKTDILIDWIGRNFSNIRTKKFFSTRCWYISLCSDLLLNSKNYGNRKTKFSYLLDIYGLRVTCLEKRIPPIIFSCGTEIRMAFLAGLFDSDGHISENKEGYNISHICSSSFFLLEDIRHLCNLEGLLTYIDPSHKHIHISNADMLKEKIEKYLLLKKFSGKLLTGLKYAIENRSNFKSQVDKNRGEKSVINYLGKSNASLYYKKDKYIRYSIANLHGISHEDVRYITIREIEKIEKANFYSISIRDNYNLVGNGIIIKNCYQEQAMAIAVKCAGFTLQEADSLRKAIGKKLPEEMAKSKKLFMEKGLQFGVLTQEQLVEVFNWIEASQRYSFNRSHAMSYGITGYMNQYIKVHFPIQYYVGWLQLEKKRELYSGLINEAKQFDVTVSPPCIQHLRNEFYCQGHNIYFGLGNIKGTLSKDIDNLSNLLTKIGWDTKHLGTSITWMMFLTNVLYNISSRTADGFIHSGALDCFSKPRALMSVEYDYYCLLSPCERQSYAEELSLLELLDKIVKDYQEYYDKSMAEWDKGPKTKKIKTLREDGEDIISTSVKKQKKAYTEYKEKLIKNNIPFEEVETEIEIPEPKPNQRLAKVLDLRDKLVTPLYNIIDTLDSIIYHEEELLGVALTRHATDGITNAAQTHSCMDIVNGYKGRAMLKVKIDTARPYQCKNGATMCFLSVSDETCILGNVVCFSTKDGDEVNGYQNFKYLLTRNNIVFMSGQLGDKGSFVINKVYAVS